MSLPVFLLKRLPPLCLPHSHADLGYKPSLTAWGLARRDEAAAAEGHRNRVYGVYRSAVRVDGVSKVRGVVEGVWCQCEDEEWCVRVLEISESSAKQKETSQGISTKDGPELPQVSDF